MAYSDKRSLYTPSRSPRKGIRPARFFLRGSLTYISAIFTILVCDFHQSIYHQIMGEYQDDTWIHEGNKSTKLVADAAGFYTIEINEDM